MVKGTIKIAELSILRNVALRERFDRNWKSYPKKCYWRKEKWEIFARPAQKPWRAWRISRVIYSEGIDELLERRIEEDDWTANTGWRRNKWHWSYNTRGD